MNWRLSILGLLLPVTAIGAAGGAPPRPAPERAASWDNYRVLVTRNIFVRDRSRGRTGPSSSRPPSTRAASQGVEDSLVLTGIGQCGQQRMAFFEDTRTGETARVSIGEPLARGRVVSVTLDSIGYEQGGLLRLIAVGQALTGETAALSTAVTTTRPATTQEAEGSPDAGGAALDPILERLRQRRAQELKP